MTEPDFADTSNVDGHFPRAGFDPDRIIEVHGAIDWGQGPEKFGFCSRFAYRLWGVPSPRRAPGRPEGG